MPWHSPTINNQQSTHSLLANCQQRINKIVRCQLSSIRRAQDDPQYIEGSVVSCRHWRPGFSYVEILLSMFLILALVAILLTTSTTYIHSRRTNLQTIATKMASCEIERLRNLNFTAVSSLPPSGSLDASCTNDLSKLPAGTTVRLVADFGSNPKIKQITAAVSWTEKGLAQQIKLETLISENGL